MPSVYQGTYIPSGEREPDKLLANIRNKTYNTSEQREQLSLLDKLNRSYLERVGHQPELEAGIQTMEVAFRMQTEAPEVFDISKESQATAGSVR